MCCLDLVRWTLEFHCVACLTSMRSFSPPVSRSLLRSPPDPLPKVPPPRPMPRRRTQASPTHLGRPRSRAAAGRRTQASATSLLHARILLRPMLLLLSVARGLGLWRRQRRQPVRLRALADGRLRAGHVHPCPVASKR